VTAFFTIRKVHPQIIVTTTKESSGRPNGRAFVDEGVIQKYHEQNNSHIMVRNIMLSQSKLVLGNLALNLRRLRLATGMSQEELGKRAGLSRRMVNGVEAGNTNISLVNLDHLAAALNVSFVDLIRDAETPTNDVNALIWQGASVDSRARLLGIAAATRNVELWTWSLAPGERYDALPDAVGFYEMILVTAGELTISFTDEIKLVLAGDFAIYRSSQTYAYLNNGSEIVHFVRNVVS